MQAQVWAALNHPSWTPAPRRQSGSIYVGFFVFLIVGASSTRSASLISSMRASTSYSLGQAISSTSLACVGWLSDRRQIDVS